MTEYILQEVEKVAKKVKPRKKERFCDPAVCSNCQYICEGDFICDKKVVPVVVVSDWEPTEDFMWCKSRRAEDGK